MRKRDWFCWLAVAAFSLSGCGGGDDDGGGNVDTGVGDYGMTLGRVKDLSGAAVAGVSVTVAGHDAVISNDQGWFNVSEITAADRLVINFKKTGYAPTAQIVRIRKGLSTFVDAVMAPIGNVEEVSSSTGGTVSHAGGSMTIQPDTLITESRTPYTGQAKVSVTVFDPTVVAHQDAFPGEFKGLKLSGETVPIISYGFVDVNVTDDSGNPLQLASGKTADLSIPIPASLRADAPATMPLWYFNEGSGIWQELGTFDRQGDAYVGTIPHFSVFNTDLDAATSTVIGRVVDRAGNPVEGARVEIRGVRPRDCWKSGETSTPENGKFRVPVDAKSVCKIVVSKNGVSSTPREFTSAEWLGELNLGDIILDVDVPKVTITLTWGSSPGDLDSHLLVPTGEHVEYHVVRTVVGGAMLDTDDKNGFGPEVVTIYSLKDGVYRYLVHDYSGRGGGSGTTISASGATATMVVEGEGIRTLTAPSGATAGAVWEVWKITVSGGRVTSVTQVSSYVNKSVIGL